MLLYILGVGNPDFTLLGGGALTERVTATLQSIWGAPDVNADAEVVEETLKQVELLSLIGKLRRGPLVPPLTPSEIAKAKGFMVQLKIPEQQLDLDVACLLGYPPRFIRRLIKWKLLLSLCHSVGEGQSEFAIFHRLFSPRQYLTGYHPLMIALLQKHAQLFDAVLSLTLTFDKRRAFIEEVQQFFRDNFGKREYWDFKELDSYNALIEFMHQEHLKLAGFVNEAEAEV
jgi:hypothetical protein